MFPVPIQQYSQTVTRADDLSFTAPVFTFAFCFLPLAFYLRGQCSGTSSMIMMKTATVRIEPTFTKSKKR